MTRYEYAPDAQEQLERVIARIDVSRETTGETYFSYRQDVERMAVLGELDLSFLVRLLTDVIPNPWQGARIVQETLDALRRRGISEERIYTSRLLMIKTIKVDLASQVDRAAENLFRKKLSEEQISFHLVSAGDSKLNWELAETIEYLVTDSDRILQKKNGENLERFLYEKTYEKEFNPLERDLAWYLDAEKAVRWWHRLVARQDYFLQGWMRHRVYPDFLACIEKSKNGFLRLTFLETKGMHLSGSPDTEYKRVLFDLLNEHGGKAKVDAGQVELFEKSGQKLTFKLLLEDTWRSDIQRTVAPQTMS